MKNESYAELTYQNTTDSGLGRVTAAARLMHTRGSLRRTLDCYALVYVIRGSGRFRDARGTDEALEAGQAFLLFPGVRHWYGPEKGATWDELYVLFEGPVFQLWQRRGLLNLDRPVYTLQPTALWESRLRRLWQDVSSPLDQICQLQLFLAAMHHLREERVGNKQDKEWLRSAQTRLAETAVVAGGAQRVARDMGMAYETFRKTFRRLYGASPGRYQNERLIEEAARRLHTESTPIKQIAIDLGFCDEFHFSHRFKQRMGVPPGVYRQRLP